MDSARDGVPTFDKATAKLWQYPSTRSPIGNVIDYLTPTAKQKYLGKLKIFQLIIGYPIDRSTFHAWRNGYRRLPLWAARRILARLESDRAILAEMIPAVEDHIRRLSKEGDKGLKGPKGEREL